MGCSPSYPSPFGYQLDSILMTNSDTGVTIFLAHPLGLPPHGPASVVIKVVPHHSGCVSNADSPLREVAALQLLPNHPHITPLLACMQDLHFVYLVFPYLAGGDLFSKVSQSVSQDLLPLNEEWCGWAHLGPPL